MNWFLPPYKAHVFLTECSNVSTWPFLVGSFLVNWLLSVWPWPFQHHGCPPSAVWPGWQTSAACQHITLAPYKCKRTLSPSLSHIHKHKCTELLIHDREGLSAGQCVHLGPWQCMQLRFVQTCSVSRWKTRCRMRAPHGILLCQPAACMQLIKLYCTVDTVLHSILACQWSIPLHYAEWDMCMEYLLPLNFLVFVQVPSQVCGVWWQWDWSVTQRSRASELASVADGSSTAAALSSLLARHHPALSTVCHTRRPAKLIVNWSAALGPSR